MIGAISYSPSVDRGLVVQDVRIGEINRVELQGQVAGGKAINAARAARFWGSEVHVVAPLGGYGREWITQELRNLGIVLSEFVAQYPTRVCESVFSRSSQELTEFYELAPKLSYEELELLADMARDLAKGASWTLVAGSLPSSTGKGYVGRLIESLHARGSKVAVDLSGAHLAEALMAGPELVKINLDEASNLEYGSLPETSNSPQQDLGRTGLTAQEAQALDLARHIRNRYSGSKNSPPITVITLGSHGAVLAHERLVVARNRHLGLYGNGCGDTLMGVMLSCLDKLGEPSTPAGLEEAFRAGLGASVANAMEPLPAVFSREDAGIFSAQIGIIHLPRK